jgi:predicted nucleic acid-binding protein
VAALVQDGASDPALAALRQTGLRWLATDDVDLRRATEIQAELSQQGQAPLPWSRLVIAAVAARYSVAVLHYTDDYDRIAEVTGQMTEWVAPVGRLSEPR